MQILEIVAFAALAVVAVFIGSKLTLNALVVIITARIFFDGVFSTSIGSPISLNSILGILIILICLGRVLKDTSSLGIAIALISGFALSTWWASTGPAGSVSWEYFLRVTVIIIWWLSIRSLPKLSLAKLLWAISSIGVFSSVFSVSQFLSGQNLANASSRFAGLLAHPNSAALVYGLAICCVVILLRDSRLKFLKTMYLVLLVLSLALTVSLGGIVTSAIILIAFFGFGQRGASAGVKASFSVLIIGVFALAIAAPLFADRISQFATIGRSVNLGESNSLEWRFGRWSEVLGFWRESPVFGLGYGASTSGALLNGYPPHNEYIRVLVDTGVVGFALALVFSIALLTRYNRARKTNLENNQLISIRLANASFIGFLFNSLTENTFTYTVPMLLLGLIVGNANSRLARRTQDTTVERSPVV